VHRLGLPTDAWWQAAAGLFGLHLLSRFATPAAANVNLAFAVWPGWERLFRSHALYIATLVAASAAVFAVLTPLLQRLAPRAGR
jgi:hypothetical protein